MTLLFLPEPRSFFLSREAPVPPGLAAIVEQGTPSQAEMVTPRKRTLVAGTRLPLVGTAAALAMLPVDAMPRLAGSVVSWRLASQFALDLVCRERVVPTLVREGDRVVARWGAALSTEDAAKLGSIARSMPPAAYAVPAHAGRLRGVWAPASLLRSFLDAMADALVRPSQGGPALGAARSRSSGSRSSGSRRHAAADFTPWEERWRAALGSRDGTFETEGFAERMVVGDLGSWSEPALGQRSGLRACFRLELPETDGEPFTLRFLLQSTDDPSLLITAAQAWVTKRRSLAGLGRAFRNPQEALLEALGRAARLFLPLSAALGEAKPELLQLDSAAAWHFLNEGAQVLAEAGFGVIVPAELTAAGQRRLRLRMRVTGSTPAPGKVPGTAGLGLDALLRFKWEAALGEQTLSARELKALARHKAPLVQHRGQWVAIDPRELSVLRRRLTEKSGTIRSREALVAALAGEIRQGDRAVAVSVGGAFGKLIAKLRGGAAQQARAPRGFVGTLRPYQARGLSWLRTMGTLGLGACLADDMGLGKTVQLLAFLLDQRHRAPSGGQQPALLVAPTSVLGNWEREATRFVPDLSVVRHYGADRLRSPRDFAFGADTMVITSYGLLRRDARLLSKVPWSTVILDEAQNIKNAASATARAARALSARHRFALTGTPVENHLTELWSIFEFANPGLLGQLGSFRREFAVPVERYGNDEVAEQLRKLSSPFLLRRLKSDPTIIQDLPAKNEMKVVCALSREQASLYQAVVDEEMRHIASATGIERSGRVLALLIFLKQICNHPAHYLAEAGPLARRSGKLDRTLEMLEEAIAGGDKALVFTQFREMGDRLVAHLGHHLGVEVIFLHGGTPRKARDAMVQRFQEEPQGPRIFVLSLKAGGTGLNLTAANHVFHFDRWWNPAVEDQATDRAYRIGQKRSVQVHKLVCAGTVEEKIDRLLEQKRALAAKVVGTGEKWITELANDELHELFALSSDAAVGIDEEGAAGQVAVQPRGRRRSGRVQP